MKVETKTLFKAIFLIILALVAFTRATSADLFVAKIIDNNKFSATTLDFSQRDTATNNPTSTLFNVSGFTAGGFKVNGVRIKKDGKKDFNYQIKTIKTLGDDYLCDMLQLTVLQDWQIKYQGSLTGLSLNSSIKDNGLDDWVFYIKLENNEINLVNKVCDFNFVFRTFRDSPESNLGFWDEEILTNHIATTIWIP